MQRLESLEMLREVSRVKFPNTWGSGYADVLYYSTLKNLNLLREH
jgi:hypothetical protein